MLLQFADVVEHPFQLALVVAQRVFGLFHRDVAAADQRFGVGLADPALDVDDVVHGGVRHRRVVALVVSTPAVAQHVDDDVLLELLAEVHGQLRHPHTGFRVVAVDVKDRRPDHLRDVGAVLAGSRVLRRGGEADLVVDDDVDGPADAVAGQVRQVQRLGDHALAGEGGVAVQHHRHDGVAVARRRPCRAGPAWPGPDPPAPGRRPPGATGWRSATPECRCRRTSAGRCRWRRGGI